MPKVLSGLGKTLETISTAMLNMEKSMKRLHSGETSDSEGRPNKTRRLAPQNEVEKDGDDNVSDAEGLLRSKEPNTSEAHVRLEHDTLLDEISQDLELEEVGGNINKQLADIVNKRWSSKLTEAKQKEKMDNYPRQRNCLSQLPSLVLTRKYGASWITKPSTMTYVLYTSTQKLLAKVGTILTISLQISYCKCTMQTCPRLTRSSR